MTEPTDLVPAAGEFLVFVGDDGVARIHVQLAEGTVWLTQRQMAVIYGKDIRTISEHLGNIYEDGELDPTATIRKFRTVRTERKQTGFREIVRMVDHYNLLAILAVGYRTRSPQGTRFRQWATARLEEYVVKGFTIDDERLKHPPGPGTPDYFDELLARIRDIRSSEKVFYKKVLAIYATSVDYDPRAETSERFFAAVQNKLHWAAHGRTAAEVIAARADASQPNLGLTSWTGERPRRADVTIAKNYLAADEMELLNRIVSAYLEFAELQATNRRPMRMGDWIQKLDEYLQLSEREVLRHAGSVSRDAAVEKAHGELDRYDAARAQRLTPVESHFEEALRTVTVLAKRRPTTRKKPGS